VLFGYTWVLMHHMLGGVRHLVWDFGHGMEPAQAGQHGPLHPRSARSFLTVLIWAVAFIAF
jgi:succinate dehydrogenase / fumarate reductase cytochrome b subunit